MTLKNMTYVMEIFFHVNDNFCENCCALWLVIAYASIIGNDVLK